MFKTMDFFVDFFHSDWEFQSRLAWIAATAAVLFFANQLVVYIGGLYQTSYFKLDGKHIFITGGSMGLGKALAVVCASQGAKVTIVARKPADLQDAKFLQSNSLHVISKWI